MQKNLADYLETKRTAFARFYFLSNDELISILSQTKDPNAVQPHLRKCFEAVHAITMQGAECEMTEMISGEKEKIPFMTKIYPRGSVEIWMGEIETMMRRSVRAVTEEGLNDYATMKRGDFVLSHCAMVVLSATQKAWTSEVEAALNDKGAEGVIEYYQKMIEQLKELSLLVRTKLTKLQSQVMSALIVMEIHARDVVEALIRLKVRPTPRPNPDPNPDPSPSPSPSPDPATNPDPTPTPTQGECRDGLRVGVAAALLLGGEAERNRRDQPTRAHGTVHLPLRLRVSRRQLASRHHAAH